MAAKTSLQTRLGRRVREVRTAKGLSQMDLVRRYDWTLSHYQKIERGDLDPRTSTLVKLAESFGLTVSELLEGL
jgi:transcriptional regulator with XRE-family HTH domain